MDWTAITIATIGVCGTIFGSTGFWQWRTNKKSKGTEVFSAVQRISGKVDTLDKTINNVNEKVDSLDGKFQDLQSEVQDVKGKTESIESKNDEERAITARVRILRFEDEVQRNIHHNKASWDQTMIDIKNYSHYVEHHPDFENGITGPTTRHLEDCYTDRLSKHDWEL